MEGDREDLYFLVLPPPHTLRPRRIILPMCLNHITRHRTREKDLSPRGWPFQSWDMEMHEPGSFETLRDYRNLLGVSGTVFPEFYDSEKLKGG